MIDNFENLRPLIEERFEKALESNPDLESSDLYMLLIFEKRDGSIAENYIMFSSFDELYERRDEIYSISESLYQEALIYANVFTYEDLKKNLLESLPTLNDSEVANAVLLTAIKMNFDSDTHTVMINHSKYPNEFIEKMKNDLSLNEVFSNDSYYGKEVLLNAKDAAKAKEIYKEDVFELVYPLFSLYSPNSIDPVIFLFEKENENPVLTKYKDEPDSGFSHIFYSYSNEKDLLGYYVSTRNSVLRKNHWESDLDYQCERTDFHPTESNRIIWKRKSLDTKQ